MPQPQPPILIDGLQYSRYSEKTFREMQASGVSAVHVTVAYHEDFRDAVRNIADWNKLFERYAELIFHGRNGADVLRARAEGRTAVFFGFQNPSPIEGDIGLVEICHALGIRFMQLSYNNQSLLATGCYEEEDAGVTRMGREVIREMNRLGMAIDMSHSGERSTLQAIEWSERPIAVTHANPRSWQESVRNKSDAVLKALGDSGGMLGFSLYPLHLKGGSDCSLRDFCEMVARTAELTGTDALGIGSDLCEDQPDSVVGWMRFGRWTRQADEGGAVFPPKLQWFHSNLHFGNLARGLREVGLSRAEADGIMGLNWLRFFEASFSPARQDWEPAAAPLRVPLAAGTDALVHPLAAAQEP